LSRSMTGFGRGEAEGGGVKFIVELKSVNHRFTEVMLRMPKQLFLLEERCKRVVAGKVSRGRVDGFISMESLAEKITTVKVDKALARSYYKAIEELLGELGVAEPVRADHILTLPGLVKLEESAEDTEELWAVLEQAVVAAVDSLVQMREIEGARLKEDLLARLGRIKEITSTIEARAPHVVEDYRLRLTQRLQEWLADSSLDMPRVMAEVTIFAERSSITEEIVRLYSHLEQAAECLNGTDPVGRKLDFIIQEMNREINTIASKSADIQISGCVVEVKSQLEKIREQVQNLE